MVRDRSDTLPAFNAVVLAGSRGPREPIAAAEGLANKCLVEIAGAPSIVRVVAALRGCGAARVLLVANDAQAFTSHPIAGPYLQRAGVDFVAAAASAPASALAGLETAGVERPMIVTTGDNALLSAGAVAAFLRDSLKTGADLTVGLAAEAALVARVPETRRTYLRFRDGRFTGCNLYAVLNPHARAVLEFWRDAERDRKRPWRLALRFGFGPLMAYAFNQLTLEAALEAAGQQLGARVAPVIVAPAEIAIDADKLDDLTIIRRLAKPLALESDAL